MPSVRSRRCYPRASRLTKRDPWSAKTPGRLQQTLNKKAGRVQSGFSAAGDTLQELARQIRNAPAADQAGLRLTQTARRGTQQAVAAEVNLWRDRA